MLLGRDTLLHVAAHLTYSRLSSPLSSSSVSRMTCDEGAQAVWTWLLLLHCNRPASCGVWLVSRPQHRGLHVSAPPVRAHRQTHTLFGDLHGKKLAAG